MTAPCQKVDEPTTDRDRDPTVIDRAWQIAYQLGFPLARVWWRLNGTVQQGALVAIHVDQSLLLLRSSYRTAWNFPGGGLRRGETPENAARRELAEEIGIKFDMGMELSREIQGSWEGRQSRVFIFSLRLARLPALRLDYREIIQARLVPIEMALKIQVTGPVRAYIEGLVARQL